MSRRAIAAADAPPSKGGYVQALEVRGESRTLYISGQVPVASDGSVPDGFEAQAHLAWANLRAQLRAADMDLENLVKVTIYLADRAYGLPSRLVRNQVLGEIEIAQTVIIAGIFDSAWLLEIEAVAMA
ncbi:MAG: RidA family protein [Kiloniellales bacterium]